MRFWEKRVRVREGEEMESICIVKLFQNVESKSGNSMLSYKPQEINHTAILFPRVSPLPVVSKQNKWVL